MGQHIVCQVHFLPTKHTEAQATNTIHNDPPPPTSLQTLLQFQHAIIHNNRSGCMCAMQTSP